MTKNNGRLPDGAIRTQRGVLVLGRRAGAVLILACAAAAAHAGAPRSAIDAADLIYRNGYVYTVDAGDSVQQALAVRAGRIVYVGDNTGAAKLAGKGTRVIDLQGRMLMPGLIDAHMHPLSGGKRLLRCNLNYEALTVPQFQARIQACVDKESKTKGNKEWLQVVNWFEQGMLPAGLVSTRATLDAINSARPIVVRSSFGHSNLVNTRGLEVAGITRATPKPATGKIVLDATGAPSGLLEDAAMELVDQLLPKTTPAENVSAATYAMQALGRQGVTSFLDASSDPEIFAAFAAVERQGKLSARAHFAAEVATEDGADPARAVASVLKMVKRYHQEKKGVAPIMRVRHAKLYMDGVIAAPALTGTMLAPYYVDRGTPQHPHWVPGDSKGPPTYFPPAALKAIVIGLATAGIDAHVHVDGDGAVRETLDAIEALRAVPAGKDARPALAHAEIVDPADFGRFAALDASAVLSFQWGKPAPDTVAGLKEYLGPQRYAILEPQSLLLDAGARVVFGSDWPVDALDEWFALKVGVTRTNAPSAGPEFAGKLGPAPGMPRAAVLRAATMNAAYTLRQEGQVGSLEVGKLADLIVLDRNFFQIPDEEIAAIKVLQTVVGGKVVHQSPGFP
ncbi:amidohydrolase family protein [Massilia sp. CCM 8695]|uniref:Amidohydrolase family protein n=1 Tax=Massilia frigida TaxID=2609281 RepID=A0ABX0NI26_9BURK|nr:amidohydrolase [Massilia frigida]NHZ80695.1 amidohydrolase family protein [Massilia frigida]